MEVPHGQPQTATAHLQLTTLSTVKVKVTLQPTVSRPVSPGVKPHLGPKTIFLLMSDIRGSVDVLLLVLVI
jgi:hypothetical protein